MRVLVVGDPYMPASVFTSALAGLDGAVAVTELQLGTLEAPPPRTESERGLREYMGDPADLVPTPWPATRCWWCTGPRSPPRSSTPRRCGLSAAPAAGR